jgi:hypothetical protein
VKITAIIPSLYTVDGEYLHLAVKSLRETTDWTIIVVTNGDPYGAPIPEIAHMASRFHTKDQGQCNAVNIGASQVSPDTDYIFMSNSDMYFAPGWTDNLRFEELCFSPNLLEPVNNAGSAPPFLKVDGGLTLQDFNKEVVDEEVAKIAENGPAAPEIGFNFPVFIRKDLWDAIGGYDVNYDPWGSNGDTDLQTKIELAGVTPKRYLDVPVYHFSNKSGTFDGTHQDFWQHNWDYYTEKWGFNRDTTNGDPWYCKNMIDYANLKYHPDWAGRFSENA